MEVILKLQTIRKEIQDESKSKRYRRNYRCKV